MTCDINTYLPFLADADLSLEEKEAVIRTVWTLLESQVLQAFDKTDLPSHVSATSVGTDLTDDT